MQQLKKKTPKLTLGFQEGMVKGPFGKKDSLYCCY